MLKTVFINANKVQIEVSLHPEMNNKASILAISEV